MEHGLLWCLTCSGPHPGRHCFPFSNGALLRGRLAVFPTGLARTSSTATTTELAGRPEAAMTEVYAQKSLAAAARVGTKSADQCGRRRSVASPQSGNRAVTRPLLAPSLPPARARCAPLLPGPMPRVFGRVARAWRPHFQPRGVYYLLDVSTGKWRRSSRCAPRRPPSQPPALAPRSR